MTVLSKFKKVLSYAAAILCLALLLCPTAASAAGSLEVTVASPTNGDHIFTGEEAYDLTVYLQAPEGGETYSVTYRVIDSRDLELVKCREPIPVTLAKDGRGELLLDLSSLKGRDTYQLEVTVTDGSGATVGEASCTFGRVPDKSVLSHVANVRNGVLFTTDSAIPGRFLYLKKEDRIPENLFITYRITDTAGRILRHVKGQIEVPYKDYIAVPLNFFGMEQAGLCRLVYEITDDTGNVRANGTAYFHHYGSDYVAGVLRSAGDKLGLIFANDEPYDLSLELWKTDSIAETLSMRYTICDSFGAVVAEASDTLHLLDEGAVSVPLPLADVTGYGTYSLSVTATDRFGHEKTLEYAFSRVLSTAEPGDLPLMNINDHFTTNTGDPRSKLQLAAQAGFGMWRSSIPWMSVEKSKGVYSMPAAVFSVIADTERLGMEPLIILAYGNDKLYGQPDPTNSAWLEAYCNYCRYIAGYFGDRITYYEIWNEWNHASMGKTASNRRAGNYYAMVLAAASEAIKSVNPNAKVIGGAMAGHNAGWMSAMLGYDGNNDGKSDAMEAMDGFSFHAYNTDWVSRFYSPSEEGYYESYDEVIAVLSRYGDASTKEIWMTESGWSTAIGPGVTEEIQAAYFVQVHTWALANPDKVDRFFWYDLMNDRYADTVDWDPAAGEHNWGLIHSWTNTGEEPLAYSAKKAYVAACAASSLLAGVEPAGTYDMGDGIYAYRFQKDGQDLLVAWMNGKTQTFNASFDGDMVITDMYGNATTLTGTATLNISDCPLYIECDLSTLTLN